MSVVQNTALPDNAQPLPCNQIMAGRRRMHTVPQPVGVVHALCGSLKHLLQLNKYRILLVSKPAHNLLVPGNLLMPPRPVLRRCACIQNKRLAQDEPGLRRHLPRLLQHMTVSAFITVGNPARLILQRSPDIIDPDQNAEHIRFQVDRILIPARIWNPPETE